MADTNTKTEEEKSESIDKQSEAENILYDYCSIPSLRLMIHPNDVPKYGQQLSRSRWSGVPAM